MPRHKAVTPSRSEASLLDMVIETAPDAVITIDSNAMILTFSPAAVAMFGYSKEEIVGQNVKCLMPEPFRSHHDDYLSHYLKTGEKRIIGIGREIRAMRKSGEIFVAELAVGEMQAGSTVVFTGFIRDVTDRVEAAKKMVSLQRTLDQVARVQLLGEMSTALAHEINQPLSAISNFARAARRLLDQAEPDIAKASSHLDRVAEQAQRAGEIIRRMRKMIDRGQADLRRDDINSIIEEAIRIRGGGVEHNVPHIVVELAPDLPPVLADRVLVQQVILNLVRNADEAMLGNNPEDVHISTMLNNPPGRITLHATASAENEVRVVVSDTGPGLPEPLLETMFDPMVTSKPGGLGVGLAICRSIVHSHGGRIWAENQANGGAAVCFTLPADEAR